MIEDFAGNIDAFDAAGFFVHVENLCALVDGDGGFVRRVFVDHENLEGLIFLGAAVVFGQARLGTGGDKIDACGS